MLCCIIFMICGAITLMIYLREKLRAKSLRAAIWKSVVSAFFAATAVSGWFSAAAGGKLPVFGALVVPGLVFGLMGDIWLDLKYVYPQDDAPLTYAGFATFGVGHILYQLGLLLQFYIHGSPLYVLLPMGLAALMRWAIWRSKSR